jgi:DnaJ like chaperone protein
VTEEELALCYRELKSLCDGKERTQVMRLLMQLAEVDGDPSTLENAELERIANELGVSMADVVAGR